MSSSYAAGVLMRRAFGSRGRGGENDEKKKHGGLMSENISTSSRAKAITAPFYYFIFYHRFRHINMINKGLVFSLTNVGLFIQWLIAVGCASFVSNQCLSGTPPD